MVGDGIIMSNKKYEHWCDDKHQEPKDDNKFVIGDMADEIYSELEQYILHDINKDLLVVFDDDMQGNISKRYVLHKTTNILDNAENLASIVVDANSIYAMYEVDYRRRRELWLEARGLCFRIIKQLKNISAIMVEGTNIKKYVRLSKELSKLANKIKNVMISDDKKKKEHCKKYFN